jgi:SnoaL-like domain
MTGDERAAMVAVAHAHAAAEAVGDIDATMATLDENPVYELQPMGRVLRGHDIAREYYEHFFARCQPRITGYELRSEWVTDDGVLQEYVLHVDDPPDTKGRFHIIGILTFGTAGKLSGERIYASDDLTRFMFGPLLERSSAA